MKTGTEHIDFKNFRKYYTGNMSASEKEVFEKNIEEDPFAKEAFEGFLLLENNHKRISAIENTNIIIKDKYGIETSNKIFPLKYILTIAASLILLVGSYFVIQMGMSSMDKTMAENKVETEVEEFELKENLETSPINEFFNDSTIEDTSTYEVFETEDTEFEEEIQVVEKNTSIANTITEPTSPNNNKEKQTSKQKKQLTSEEFDYYRNQKDAANNKTSASQTISIEETAEEIEDKSFSTTESENDNSFSYYKQGIVAYNQSNYSKAIKSFNNSISQNKNVSSSNFYLAMSYFNQNKSAKAIKYFDKTLSVSNSPFKDQAQWYKALALINKGDKNKASTLLNNIANSNSTFKNAAIDKLKTL